MQATENWVRCKKCGHKLFKADGAGNVTIEVKGHSCKEINIVKFASKSK